jgi:osmotically-inducible protein OsmY
VKQQLKKMAPVLMLGMVFALPAWAQNSVPAGQSMHNAGEKLEQAGTATVGAASDAYHGTKRAAKDTIITGKVKMALRHDESTEKADIDVDTTAGVVTLAGKVPSRATAARAVRLAMQTEGVRRVNNEMTVMPMPSSAD